jgi:drug/metabolite transporter (DMT)-like permease
VYTYLCYAACAAVLAVTCGVQGLGLLDDVFSPVVIGLLLAVFSTILGHSIFSWCLKFFSPSFVSAAKLCEPVVASILAVFLFGEVPTLMQLAGGILILGGLYAYSRVEGGKQ